MFRSWELLILNYQLVSALNVAAIIATIFFWFSNDVTEIFSFTHWNEYEVYLFFGPVIA